MKFLFWNMAGNSQGKPAARNFENAKSRVVYQKIGKRLKY